MGVIVCGSTPNENGKITCPCCEVTRDKGEEDISNLCWSCLGGDNFECARCLHEGILFTVFQIDNPVIHVIRQPGVDGTYISECGDIKVTLDEVTGWGVPNIPFCGTCNPDIAYTELERIAEDAEWPFT